LLMARIPSEYATNTVACKLWSLVNDGSPTEFILGLALFDELSNLYPDYRCWIYSCSDFFANSQWLQQRPDVFILVPQLNIPNVGHVDFAIFDPHISTQNPLVVVECDGHNFHERTSNQASEDRRRDRVLQWLGYPLLRFTGTDIVRNKTEVAREIAEFVDQRLSEKHAHLAEVAEREAEFTELMYHRYGVL
jgi:very-short-patch-repair endonuclease